MKITSKRVTALDLGSSAIKMAVADIDSNSKIPDVLGFIALPSKGIKNGMIVDIEATTAVIKEAKQRLEKRTGTTIESCYTSISGDHITGINTNGRISISKENTVGLGEPDKITPEDVRQVQEHTKGYGLSSDRGILHLFPTEYIIDGRPGITKPIGLSGKRLQVNAHLSTFELTAAENINSCLERAGIKLKKLVLQSLASAVATLDRKEKENGVVLMDIGAGTTDIIVYYNNQVYYTGILTTAGDMVTHDISIITGIPANHAEKIKKDYGYATESVIDEEETYNIEGMSGRKPLELTNTQLAKYINARLEEILKESQQEAHNSNITKNLEPVVCLCGGTALFPGFEDVADKLFSSSPLAPNLTRIGVPTGFTGSHIKELTSPEYTALIGLLKFAAVYKGDSIYQKLKKTTNLWDKFKKLLDKF